MSQNSDDGNVSASDSSAGSVRARPDRYGRRPSRSGQDRGLRIAFVVFLALLVSGTVWFGLDHANRDVTASIPSFEVTSDRTVEAHIEVRKDKDDTAVCILRSRSEDGTEVGRKEVRIPAADSKTVTVVEVLQTIARPNTAELDGCRII
ncbi:DUF4307 domain-containing protein [Yinghuangia sp. YIM S10712]|uniref:DUF4307 domain-containing protein n=1 Tax=Yinghuangia sp. YIM S10712 TaxID=3436930 RepID=UPI003F53517C